MKILHSADWHLDSPLQGRNEAQTRQLRRELLQLPGKIAALCCREGCDMMVLCGDLFDGTATRQSVAALRYALEEVQIPVFISPGNHDFVAADSPWLTESWPGNVHIFKSQNIEAVDLPQLDCSVYGAGFTAMDCPGLLENFQAEGDSRYAIGVFHGDAAQPRSDYCPITRQQVTESALTYLALGHIHKGGAFRAGDTLCAWPGCPMGRGFDEQGEKGVLIITLEDAAYAEFVPLDTPRFYDLQIDSPEDAAAALEAALPPVENRDFYRVTFTGTSEGIDCPRLYSRFSHIPNLELRDQT